MFLEGMHHVQRACNSQRHNSNAATHHTDRTRTSPEVDNTRQCVPSLSKSRTFKHDSFALMTMKLLERSSTKTNFTKRAQKLCSAHRIPALLKEITPKRPKANSQTQRLVYNTVSVFI